MNNGPQGGPSSGQPPKPQQNQQQMRVFKPEHIRQLPDIFGPEEKEKWEKGLRQLYAEIENNAAGTPNHENAKRKIVEFSKNVHSKLATHRANAAQQAAAAARPNSQGQPSQGGESSAANAQMTDQASQKRAKLMKHVNDFPYHLPPGTQPNTADATKWLSDAKTKYMKSLVNMTNAIDRLQQLEGSVQKRVAEGRPLTAEEDKDYKDKKEALSKMHTEYKQHVDGFRAQQAQFKAAKDAKEGANANAGQGSPTQPQPSAGPNNGPPPNRPQMNLQQPGNPALQNTQTVNAAIEAARNQQMGGARPQNSSQPQQLPTPTAPSMPQNPNQHPGIKQESAIPPPLNTSITQMQGRPGMQNSPQSAVPPQSAGAPPSATSQAPQIPRALSHQAAVAQAARSYSSGGQGSSGQVMGHSHPSVPRESQNIVTNKLPIPKALHEAASRPPQPVPISQSRPTFTGGPSSVGNGSMSQPVLPKTPAFNLSSDDNSVLSKKKLDELVKQVTGGGQGDGPSLMPEVEAVSVPVYHFLSV